MDINQDRSSGSPGTGVESRRVSLAGSIFRQNIKEKNSTKLYPCTHFTRSQSDFGLIFFSKTIPIYKKGSRLLVSNYRPISLLSNLNKILEKIVHDRVYSFLEDALCIYSLQFGFRKKHSTNHALIEIT